MKLDMYIVAVLKKNTSRDLLRVNNDSGSEHYYNVDIRYDTYTP